MRAVIQLARSFNLETVAEGVKDKDVLHLLRHLNCDIVQGYYFAHPMAADTFAQWPDQHLRWSACCIIAADSELRVEPLLVGVKLIQGIEVRLGRSHHDVRIRPLTIDDASLLRQPHGDFALGIGSVMLLTEYSCRSAPLCASFSIARKAASTAHCHLIQRYAPRYRPPASGARAVSRQSAANGTACKLHR